MIEPVKVTCLRMIAAASGAILLCIVPLPVRAEGETKPEATQPQQAQLSNPLEQAISGMRDAQQRIEKQDAGDETRRIQQKVVNDLDVLIKMAEQNARRQSKSQQSKSQSDQQQQDQDRSKEQSEKEPGQSNADRQDRKDNAAESEDRSLQGGKSEANPTEQGAAAEVWGHLPERLRQRLRNIDAGKTLPKYSELVRRYFESLAEQGQKEQRK